MKARLSNPTSGMNLFLNDDLREFIGGSGLIATFIENQRHIVLTKAESGGRIVSGAGGAYRWRICPVVAAKGLPFFGPLDIDFTVNASHGTLITHLPKVLPPPITRHHKGAPVEAVADLQTDGPELGVVIIEVQGRLLEYRLPIIDLIDVAAVLHGKRERYEAERAGR